MDFDNQILLFRKKKERKKDESSKDTELNLMI